VSFSPIWNYESCLSLLRVADLFLSLYSAGLRWFVFCLVVVVEWLLCATSRGLFRLLLFVVGFVCELLLVVQVATTGTKPKPKQKNPFSKNLQKTSKNPNHYSSYPFE
jgi:hypothetical protein